MPLWAGSSRKAASNCSTVAEEMILDFRPRFRKAVIEIADLDDLRAILQFVNVIQSLRHRLPTAITVTPVALPLVKFVCLCLHHAVDLVVHHAGKIVALRRLM
jgi:uncharacterized protein (DUF58 family)